MKASFVILAAILGGVFALDLPTEPRAWTGWDIASRSGEIEDNNVGKPRAWTGWDIASRSGEIEDNNVESRAWTGWDIASRSGEIGQKIAANSINNVPAGRDPRFNVWDAATQGFGGMINKGKELRMEARKEIRETVLRTINRMNQTLNYYCKKEETGNYTCSVCVQIIRTNYTLCSNLIVDRQNLQLTGNIKINNYTIVERSYGVRNPPPMCVPFPHLPVCSFCLRAYNLQFNGTTEFKGCLEAEVVVPFENFDFPLTCIKINDTGVHFNRTEAKNKPGEKKGLLKKLF